MVKLSASASDSASNGHQRNRLLRTFKSKHPHFLCCTAVSTKQCDVGGVGGVLSLFRADLKAQEDQYKEVYH